MTRSIFCGDTNYRNQSNSEIQKDFRKMCQETNIILSRRREIDHRDETPVDIGIVFRQIFYLAERIIELQQENNLSFHMGRPSLLFCETLIDAGKRASNLHRELGSIWHGSSYYHVLVDNSVESIHYADLRNYCCSMIDLNNMGHEIKQRFFDGAGKARYPSLSKALGEFFGGMLKTLFSN